MKVTRSLTHLEAMLLVTLFCGDIFIVVAESIL